MAVAVADVVTDVALGTFHRENTRDRARKRAANSNLARPHSRITRGKKVARESLLTSDGQRRERGSTARRPRDSNSRQFPYSGE